MSKFITSDTVFRINFLKNELPALFKEIVKFSTTNVFVSDLKIPDLVSDKQVEAAVNHPSKIVSMSFDVLYYMDQVAKTLANKNLLLKEYSNCVLSALDSAKKLRDEHNEILGNDGEKLLDSDLKTLRSINESMEQYSTKITIKLLNDLVLEQDKNWENFQKAFSNKIGDYLVNNKESIRLNDAETIGLLEDQPAVIANKREILSNAGVNVEGFSDFKINLCFSLHDYQARNVGKSLDIIEILREANEQLEQFERDKKNLVENIEKSFAEIIYDLDKTLKNIEGIRLLNSDDVQRIRETQHAYQQRLDALNAEKQQNLDDEHDEVFGMGD